MNRRQLLKLLPASLLIPALPALKEPTSPHVDASQHSAIAASLPWLPTDQLQEIWDNSILQNVSVIESARQLGLLPVKNSIK